MLTNSSTNLYFRESWRSSQNSIKTILCVSYKISLRQNRMKVQSHLEDDFRFGTKLDLEFFTVKHQPHLLSSTRSMIVSFHCPVRSVGDHSRFFDDKKTVFPKNRTDGIYLNVISCLPSKLLVISWLYFSGTPPLHVTRSVLEWNSGGVAGLGSYRPTRELFCFVFVGTQSTTTIFHDTIFSCFCFVVILRGWD